MKEQKIFELKRDVYRGPTTLGEMYDPEGCYYCYTLEDVVRAYGIKDKNRTAIPATEGDFTYKLAIRNSPKFGEVVVIYTREENGIYYLEYGGISFTQILFHGGNDEEDSSGCILGNKTRNVKNMTAQGSMKVDFKNKVKALIAEGFEPRLRVTNLPQAA